MGTILAPGDPPSCLPAWGPSWNPGEHPVGCRGHPRCLGTIPGGSWGPPEAPPHFRTLPGPSFLQQHPGVPQSSIPSSSQPQDHPPPPLVLPSTLPPPLLGGCPDPSPPQLLFPGGLTPTKTKNKQITKKNHPGKPRWLLPPSIPTCGNPIPVPAGGPAPNWSGWFEALEPRAAHAPRGRGAALTPPSPSPHPRHLHFYRFVF